jgi:hypothetical protein
LDLTPGSGSGPFFKGDLGSAFGWFIEAKTRVGTDLRFKPLWWFKALHDADVLGRPHVAVVYRFADTSHEVFYGYPKELMILPMIGALRPLVQSPSQTYVLGTKESRIPYREFRDLLRSNPRRQAGTISLEFSTTLRGIPKHCRLVVADSRFLHKVIQGTR